MHSGVFDENHTAVQQADRDQTLVRRARHIVALAIITALAVVPTATAALAQGIPLIRDTEIENLLSDYAKPIFRAAGQDRGRISMRIVRSEAFNAFVVDGTNVYIHTGALTQAATPNEIIGVIAHETGHITGGHLAAFRARVARDQTKSLLAQILGIGLMVAGGIAGGDTGREVAGAGTGVLYGGNELITRSLLAERRSQESAADQAGLMFLEATRQSGLGMLATFERFAQQEYISDTYQDPFVRSHPVASTRLARLRQLVERSPYYGNKDSAKLQERHDLMRAKLAGYLSAPQYVFNQYPPSDQSLPARYARAIAQYFRGGEGGLPVAIQNIDQLISERPGNPYFQELKADLYMRSGRSAEAIPALRKAIALAGQAPLMQVQLAQALQNAGAKNGTRESITLLKDSLKYDKNAQAYRLLANAYYKESNLPMADAMIAQSHFLVGDLSQAQIFAKRAEKKLRNGSPEWVKNDDIIKFQPPS